MSILARLMSHRTSPVVHAPVEPSAPAVPVLVHDAPVFVPQERVSAYIRGLNARGRTAVSSAPVPTGFLVTTGHYCTGAHCGACSGVRA